MIIRSRISFRRFFTWTVNEEEDIRTMINRNVDSIIGNFPDRVTRIRQEMLG